MRLVKSKSHHFLILKKLVNSDQRTEREVAVPSVSGDARDSASGPEISTVIVDPWIKVISEFNDGEKLRSKKKGSFSSPNGSKNTNGFHITVRSKQHSVKRVQNTDSHTIIRHSSSPNLPLVSVIGRKVWNDYWITTKAKTTRMPRNRKEVANLQLIVRYIDR
jgi:hypothetical protein